MQLGWFSMYNLYHYMPLKQRDEREPLSDGHYVFCLGSVIGPVHLHTKSSYGITKVDGEVLARCGF